MMVTKANNRNSARISENDSNHLIVQKSLQFFNHPLKLNISQWLKIILMPYLSLKM